MHPDLDSTTTHVYFKNETAHEIAILYYYPKDGTREVDTLRVAPGSTLEKVNWDSREANFAVASTSDYGRYVCDSAQVVFDGNYRVSRYLNSPADSANKHYSNSSLRNIFNEKSYDISGKDVTKRRREVTYIYTFIDPGYVYASQ
ncbi:hypothetical protein DN068_14545 [Taibaiella soli]|uniref:Uncharacterized protein n=1 Tax=Taibaiella soli TaxID=1649169 RepID=A0A2W2AA38_9BACT|nr:hypothetical protein DN068_14545 [Taibaiella soli]